ncbi:MAG: hypothetical protein M3P30_16390 [Chloroflexota bacterium]|nr:hypothetical protein [Chloroflexota bacterium]
MPIEDRSLKAGTVLTARHKKQDRTCEVVETPDGLRYRLDDGTEHKSPSSAGKVAMGGVACNGWRFWSIQGTEPTLRVSKPKAEKPAKTPAKAKAPAKTKKGAKAKSAKKAKAAKKPKGKAMRAKATDVASYGCGACGATFGSQKAAIAHALTHTS